MSFGVNVSYAPVVRHPLPDTPQAALKPQPKALLTGRATRGAEKFVPKELPGVIEPVNSIAESDPVATECAEPTNRQVSTRHETEVMVAGCPYEEGNMTAPRRVAYFEVNSAVRAVPFASPAIAQVVMVTQEMVRSTSWDVPLAA